MSLRGDRRTFRNEDIVLKVSKNIDPAIWNEGRYESFLDELCEHREYQKEAIRVALRYLLGGGSADLRDLARKNFDANEELQSLHGRWEHMERSLQLPDQLACSIDLATGSGKSYVLYGIAAILLAEGVVDRVLVLCPSNTIEAGLLEKFKMMATNPDLRDLMPADARITTPHVINASESIVDGSICIENYHAILENVKSSIRDSLKGKGARVAVLNDEAHHVANESTGTVKRWKEFLLNPEYGFRYIIGVSGTCYIGNDYFADVIHRYSLRQAIEERYIKKIEYVCEAPNTDTAEEKWQLIWNRHQDWKKKLKKRGIRPLTLIVTSDIKNCKQVAEELIDWVKEWENISTEQAAEKVLAVSSHKDHQANLIKLKNVDNPSSKVEWIISVSMLSEGWDVKNIFQIVPHEERAFNSKLLIAQVLGRGLRRPDGWTGEDPVVTVFNHDAWAGRIKYLVNEVLEIERRLTSRILPESAFNFELHNLDYTRIEDVSEYAKSGEYKLFENGFVALPTQVENEAVTIEFAQATTGERTKFSSTIVHKTYSIEEIAEQIYQRLKGIDDESATAEDPKDRTNYSKKFPLEKCEEIVRESLKQAKITSGRIIDENRQKFLQALGTLRRKSAKRVVYKLSPNALVTLSTSDRQADSCSAAELRRESKTIFFTDGCDNALPDEQREFFAEVKDIDGDFRGSSTVINNSADFKCPLNFAIADATPERRFIRNLVERDNVLHLDAWLKNTPVGFYTIDYAWKKGEHPKRGEFSPDFFIKQENIIFVVEIKGDEEITDPSPDNIKKHEYALEHFDRLNEWLEKDNNPIRYQFNMLTPKDYNKFFQKLRERDLSGFVSSLDVAIKKSTDYSK